MKRELYGIFESVFCFSRVQVSVDFLAIDYDSFNLPFWAKRLFDFVNMAQGLSLLRLFVH